MRALVRTCSSRVRAGCSPECAHLLFSYTVNAPPFPEAKLHRPPSLPQFLGVGFVLAGVCMAAWPADPAGSPLAGVSPVFTAIYVFSMLFPVRLCCLTQSNASPLGFAVCVPGAAPVAGRLQTARQGRGSALLLRRSRRCALTLLHGGTDQTGHCMFAAPVVRQAIDTVLKERVFRAARAKLGTDLDLFVMNSNASLLQVGAVSVCSARV